MCWRVAAGWCSSLGKIVAFGDVVWRRRLVMMFGAGGTAYTSPAHTHVLTRTPAICRGQRALARLPTRRSPALDPVITTICNELEWIV
jgi:hypothetical protein